MTARFCRKLGMKGLNMRVVYRGDRGERELTGVSGVSASIAVEARKERWVSGRRMRDLQHLRVVSSVKARRELESHR